MAAKPFSNEELNFFKFSSIVFDEFPNMLRATFVKLWNTKISVLGCNEWDDTPEVRALFLKHEGGTTDVPTNRSYHDWDCTNLFRATIYSKTFGISTMFKTQTLNDQYIKGRKTSEFHPSLISPGGIEEETLTLAIDQVRLLRNHLCHLSKSKMKKADFLKYVQLAKDAFAATGYSTFRVDYIGNLKEDDFPTNEVNRLRGTVEFIYERVTEMIRTMIDNNELFQVAVRRYSNRAEENEGDQCIETGCLAKEGVILVIFFNGRIKHEQEPRDLDIEASIGDLLDALKKDPRLVGVLENAVKRALGSEKHDQEITNIEKGSLLVSLHCFTDERFLEVLDDLESKRLQESFLKELALIGIEMEEIEIKILNMEEVNKERNAAKTRIAVKEGNLEETEESKSKLVMEPKELNIGKLENIRMRNHLGIAKTAHRSGDHNLNSGKYKEAIECYEITIESLNVIEDLGLTLVPNIKSILHLNKGMAYSGLKEYQNAIDCFKKGLSLSDDKIPVARGSEGLGRVYFALGQYEEAINSYKIALDANTAIGDKQRIAHEYINIGACYAVSGEERKAIEYLKKGLERSIAADDRIAIAGHKNLGHCYSRLGEHKNAIYHFEKYFEFTSKDSHSKFEIMALLIAYNDSGERKKAVKLLKKTPQVFKFVFEAKNAKNDSEFASDCANAGLTYAISGENEKGIELCKRGLEASTAIEDHINIARNNKNLGTIYSMMGEHEKAIYHYEENLKITTSIASPSEIAFQNRLLGDEYLSLHKYEEAIDSYKTSLGINISIDYCEGMVDSKIHLACAYRAMGEFEKAIECHEEINKLCIARDFKKGISFNYSNMGFVYVELGEYRKALDCFKKVSTDEFSDDDKSNIEAHYANMGCAYLFNGEYKLAIDSFEKSLKIATEEENLSQIAITNCLLGQAYLKVEEEEKSLKYLKDSLEICTQLGDKPLLFSKAQRSMGDVFLGFRDLEMAINCYTKGLEKAEEVGSQRDIASCTACLGNAYFHLGQYEKAIFYSKKALEISTTNDQRILIPSINLVLCNIYINLGEYEKAIEYCKVSLEVRTAMGDPKQIASCNETFGKIYSLSGQYEVASTYLRKSIIDYDQLFLNEVPDLNKLSFANSYIEAHNLLMSCFVSLSRIESGLLAIDLGRAKELHLCIERKHNALDENMLGYAGTIWDKIENREEQEEIGRIQNIFQVENNEASILVFAFDIKKCLNVWILNGNTIFMQWEEKFESFLWLISKLSQSFEISMNRDSSFFKLYPSDNLLNPMNSGVEVPSKMFEPKTSLENTSGKVDMNNENILKELYKLLIDPVKDVVKGKKLIVVPDKQLFFLPFSSLIDENDCYLSQSYSIQITPSLHTLKLSMERSNDSADSGFALFVGNPTVGRVSLNDVQIEPASLPNAAEEVASLSKLFAARPLVKAEAKKQVVLELLSDASIIHIAAHGEPRRGEIMLAPDLSLNEPSSSLPDQDSYLLTQKDITGIPLQARLVVLCCCHTGKGKISSEGVIGVARSFLAAGARSVLATLWPISDDATKEFMEAFYGELLQKTSVCEALRRVMNLFQQHERKDYRSFFIWAPFTLYGEDVMFTKGDIETIRKKSSETLPECGFALFVGNPTSDLPKATEEVNSLSKLFKTKAFVEDEARKQVLLGLLSGASIIHISAHIEPKQCAIMLSPCVSSNQASSTLPEQDDFLTQKDVQGLSLKAGLVVLCLRLSEQDEISPEGVETLALSFLAAGARSVLTTLGHSDDDATTEFIKAFYNHLLHESSVREALEKTKELLKKRDKGSHRSFVGRAPFTIYGEDMMFQKHDIETIREKSDKMFSGFVVLPSDELTGSFKNLDLEDKP
ncbi:tetratricopeptide repeat protein 28-like [Dendronephthya gigantea]|uniref:tetratricopeptide repeat protein 28-like n=1 Tax=Dendronephthya gigantea TaxID=151771 RepID=UPI00106D8AC0|nr:tetratricopeptide repeat protein 28-like [Dendronephthya gigantea]XP_028400959.1 tetratricopeptide repeat protein 28-like [Dendronephthya gigantea]